MRLPRWAWIAAAWTGVGLIYATQTVISMRASGTHHAWATLFITHVVEWLPWALATPLIIRLGRRYPPTRNTPALGWTLHLAAVIATGLADTAWSATLDILFNPSGQTPSPGPFMKVWVPKLLYGQLGFLILYAFILTIVYVLESRQRIARQQMEAVRLSEQLHRAQLEALRRQVEPHFIYNTLNAIAGLVRDNRSADAVEMIVTLSEFLRGAAVDSNRPQVSLEQEVQYLRQYLQIQKARFPERLQVSVEIPPELLAAQVPALVLQPLVENAIKHGIAKRAQGGTIRVNATSTNGTLRLSVDNDGPSLGADWETRGTGIGISNLRTRLALMYGGAFELHLRNRSIGGVQALISLPLVES
jgi:signal transduction histidine kinase